MKKLVIKLVGIFVLGLSLLFGLSSVAAAQSSGTNGRILFSGSNGNWTVKPDGNDIHQLSGAVNGCSNRNLVYSPNGDQIAYSYTVDNKVAIWLRNADFGNDPKQLTNNSAGNDCDPYYSPDGSRVAFTRQVSGSHTEVFVVKTDGSGSQQLTNDLNGTGNSAMPVWKDNNSLYVIAGGKIVNISAATANQTTGNVVVSPESGTNIRSVDVNPNTGALVFCQSIGAGQQIHTSTNSGANNTVIINEGAAGVHNPCFPAFSPDGSKIVFVGNKSSVGNLDPGIFIADANGGSIAPIGFNKSGLVATASNLIQPFWGTNQGSFSDTKASAAPATPKAPNTGTVQNSKLNLAGIIILSVAVVLGFIGLMIYWLRIELKKDKR